MKPINKKEIKSWIGIGIGIMLSPFVFLGLLRLIELWLELIKLEL